MRAFQEGEGHNCLVYWEEGLGCALIKSTLGPGNPGGVESQGGGKDTRMQRGTRG